MDYPTYNEDIEKYRGGLDTCNCDHIKILHVDNEYCMWCACSSFQKKIDSKKPEPNK